MTGNLSLENFDVAAADKNARDLGEDDPQAARAT